MFLFFVCEGWLVFSGTVCRIPRLDFLRCGANYLHGGVVWDVCLGCLSGNVWGWMFDVFLSLSLSVCVCGCWCSRVGPATICSAVCLGVSLLGCFFSFGWCCCRCCRRSASVLGVCWFFCPGVAQIPPVFICAAPCWLANLVGGSLACRCLCWLGARLYLARVCSMLMVSSAIHGPSRLTGIVTLARTAGQDTLACSKIRFGHCYPLPASTTAAERDNRPSQK